jgi:hypothetical protein
MRRRDEPARSRRHHTASRAGAETSVPLAALVVDAARITRSNTAESRGRDPNLAGHGELE